ncbi:MAG: polyprenyl synthetase family protein [Clostridia bacterium]|nr:polyprenyl synthetase family protein [Clostridia bacterium]
MDNKHIEQLNSYAKLTEDYLVSYLNSLSNVPGRLLDGMLYSIEAGGKRLRPALLLGTCSIFNESRLADAVPYAASIEMIHTYSLIHDDLPSMDDDEMRRGKPSNHMVFGEAGAILAGDALLNTAVENILAAIRDNPAEENIRAGICIMESAGSKGMIGGQVLDIEGAADADTLKDMHMMKTGALINASVAAGGILGGCSKADEKALMEFSENLGCAFQIKDDILDVEGAAARIGKPTGSDSRNDRVTYTSLYGVATSKDMLGIHIEKAIDALGKINGDTGFLECIAVYIRDRKE